MGPTTITASRAITTAGTLTSARLPRPPPAPEPVPPAVVGGPLWRWMERAGRETWRPSVLVLVLVLSLKREGDLALDRPEGMGCKQTHTGQVEGREGERGEGERGEGERGGGREREREREGGGRESERVSLWYRTQGDVHLFCKFRMMFT